MNDAADVAPLDALLDRLRAVPNDPVAWEQLFHHAWPFVVALSHRSLPAARRLLDAEDIAQEVFLKFARYWREARPSLTGQDALFALLAVITRRMGADAGRWLVRARRDSRRDRSAPLRDLIDRTDDQAEIDLRDLLDRVCGALDDDERRVLNLRLQGYELAEIAEQIGVSPRTIERRMQRLRELALPYLRLDE